MMGVIPMRLPDSAQSQAMHDQTHWTLAACARVLRPVLRLALSLGLKYQQLDELIRTLLLDEAERLLRERGQGRANVSQLSTATGLNRKDVGARWRAEVPELPPTALSPAARLFTSWHQMVVADPALATLPIRAEPPTVSFEQLAQAQSRGNVHHRAVLDDLLRLGVAELDGPRVRLVAEGFVPARDLKGMLAFLGDNAHDHLQTAVSNTLRQGPPQLERAVFADGLMPADAERVHQLMRSRWEALHQELVRELTQAVEAAGGRGDQRIRIGTYVHRDAAPPAAPQQASSEPPSA